MKRAALLLLAAAGVAHAHTYAGARDVVVQAEPDAVAILVTYRPSTLTFVPPQPDRERLELALARRALAVVTVKLDGVVVRDGDMKLKLADDRPRMPLVAALLSVRVPAGRHRLSVDVDDADVPTTTRWLDHSKGRIDAFGPRPAGQSFPDKGQLVLEWRP